MQFKRSIPVTLMLLSVCLSGFPQETGMPFIRNYSPGEYRASQQNWAIVQDERGIMYFGNNNGLLEFDGVTWRLIQLPGVRSMAIDSTGKIFAGLENDFGYLQPDNSGSYIYHSLKEKLPQKDRDITTVFRVFITRGSIIFQTSDKLFLYKDDNFKVLPTLYSYHLAFTVNDRYYVREPGKGVFTLQNDSLFFVEGSERFATERIYSMLPFGKNEILIATRTQGILTYSPENLEGFKKPDNFKEVDLFLSSNPVYCGTILKNGDYVLGAATGGMIVFDSDGRIKSRYNKSTGLQDNTILWLFDDSNGQLWAALDNGISLIQNNLPFRYFTEQKGLNGSPLTLAYFRNHLYVGTGQYLHIQDKNGIFRQIKGSENQNFCLAEAQGKLLLAQYMGIFEVKDDKVYPLENTPEVTGLSFCTIPGKPRYLLAGTGEGLLLLEFDNSSWKVKRKIKGFNKSGYLVAIDKLGNAWFSTLVEMYKLNLSNALDSITSSRQYKMSDGLPSDYALPFKLKQEEIVFGTDNGIYRYLPGNDCFEPHPDFKMLTGKMLSFIQLDNGDIWFDEQLEYGNYEKGFLKFADGKYSFFKTPFYKFNTMSCAESPFNLCKSPDGTIFFGTNMGLIKYTPGIESESNRRFSTLIRMVLSRDSLLFGGEHPSLQEVAKLGGNSLPYRLNDLTFHFAATFFEDSEKNLYSYRLIGLDTSWSEWTADHKKEYTNLREGRYIFEVKSKNQYQDVGSTSAYSFAILAPWYRTWWASLLYIIFSLLFIWSIVRFNIRRLVKQKKELEGIVASRTQEVVEQKKKIENAHEEITASINYARYIQSSLLPKAEELESCLGDYFILHKPVEIVSGDFYWVSEKEGKKIVAAVDCTGHGVPGAFMSMLGITLLDEIVNKESVTAPGLILDRLREEITASLKQKGKRGEQKDGMDISVCCIDANNKKMQFAGANQIMYLIRESLAGEIGIIYQVPYREAQLAEIRGNPMPVGISDEMGNFTTHEINLVNGDIFYLFTDGFPDQFGGSNHKKFSYKRFRDLLLTQNGEKMADQKSILEKALEDWMGNENQTDDILVIGFRIH
jgi:serine phosphatase RsbU (regulator of sigma subunit)/ligand-binding sensor domain-containing protein